MMTMDYEPTDTDDDDAFLEFCADNYLDPDSRRAQRLWAEQIDYLDGKLD